MPSMADFFYRIVPLLGGFLLLSSCTPPASECRTAADCAPDEQCVPGGGLFVQGGRCISGSIFSADASPPSSDVEEVGDSQVRTDARCPADIGRSCGERRPIGADCTEDSQCDSEYCAEGHCEAPSCVDEDKNGNETDVDCGGPDCEACETGDRCRTNSDCRTGACNMTGETGICTSPSCADGRKNGQETGVDCGGMCPGCEAGKSCAADRDCRTNRCDNGKCVAVITGGLTADDPGRWTGGESAVSCREYMNPSRDHYFSRHTNPAMTDSNGVYEIQPQDGEDTHEVVCNMERQGGGWTLVLISAEDGQTTWTWNNRTLLTTDTRTVGSVAESTKDFKSAVYHLLDFRDLLFVHRSRATTSGADRPTWAYYKDVGSGDQTIGEFIANQGVTCYADTQNQHSKIKPGFQIKDGNIAPQHSLCSTDLYFNPQNQRGESKCEEHGSAFGPAWSVDNGDCPMGDPGKAGSLGLSNDSPRREAEARGFGEALKLNKTDARIEMYVR